ncbi:MurR/RpiR family transcriptional regulator [Pediococcus siamensis]|uniref:MurR/RpiR family transcriptional regulator n=1 Tax=Pediococcus siamensis TaxID=381829 RepID=UPI0039A0A50F
MSEYNNINNLGLLNALSRIINSGNKDSNYSIATYIIHNMHRIKNLSINDIVDEAYSSRSAVRRFAEYLGYENYSDLKESINKLIYPSDLRHRNIDTLENHRNKLDKLIDNMIDDINVVWSENVLQECVELIHSHAQVLLIGANNTSGDLIRFQQELIFANKIVSVISGPYTNNQLSQEKDDNRLIVTVSASGKFAEIANDWIRKLSGNKILITADRADFFKKTYNQILYISQTSFTEDYLGIYGKYGITYILDLISTSYLFQYAQQ